jgi:hypothetical protein
LAPGHLLILGWKYLIQFRTDENIFQDLLKSVPEFIARKRPLSRILKTGANLLFGNTLLTAASAVCATYP